jgi:hypothetical protein
MFVLNVFLYKNGVLYLTLLSGPVPCKVYILKK